MDLKFRMCISNNRDNIINLDLSSPKTDAWEGTKGVIGTGLGMVGGQVVSQDASMVIYAVARPGADISADILVNIVTTVATGGKDENFNGLLPRKDTPTFKAR